MAARILKMVKQHPDVSREEYTITHISREFYTCLLCVFSYLEPRLG